MSTLKLA